MACTKQLWTMSSFGENMLWGVQMRVKAQDEQLWDLRIKNAELANELSVNSMRMNTLQARRFYCSSTTLIPAHTPENCLTHRSVTSCWSPSSTP